MVRHSRMASATTALLAVVSLLASASSDHCPSDVAVSTDQFPLDGILLLLSSNASVFLTRCNERPLLEWKSARSEQRLSLCSFNFSALPPETLETANLLADIHWTLHGNGSSCRSALLDRVVELPFETASGEGWLIFNSDCVCYNHDQADQFLLVNTSDVTVGNYTYFDKEDEVLDDHRTPAFRDEQQWSSNASVVDGCEPPDRCLPNGHCVSLWNGTYSCQCLPNFCGDHCQYVLQCEVECSSGPSATCQPEVCRCRNVEELEVSGAVDDPCVELQCLNNGTCVSESNGNWSSAAAVCHCGPGFTGARCETALLPPQTVATTPPTATAAAAAAEEEEEEENETKLARCKWPCLSGGWCAARNYCECPKYYLGLNCGFLHTCAMYLPCENGGDCVLLGEDDLKTKISQFQTNAPYSCECKPGWTGRHCEEDSSSAHSCSDNGVWNATLKRCVCYVQYAGEHCQTRLLAPLHPCQGNQSLCGSHGTCVVAGDQPNDAFSCHCSAGFQGKFCDSAVGGGSVDSSVLIVGAVLGSLCALGLLIGAVLLAAYLRRSRELKGKYNPAKEEMKCATVSALPLSNLKTGERLI